jgi:hypothetical protein
MTIIHHSLWQQSCTGCSRCPSNRLQYGLRWKYGVSVFFFSMWTMWLIQESRTPAKHVVDQTDFRFILTPAPLLFTQYPHRRQLTFLEIGNIQNAWRTLHSFTRETLQSYMLTPFHREPNGGRVFQYQIIFPQTNSPQTCLSLCSQFGYPAAGMEYGDECCERSTVLWSLYEVAYMDTLL